MTQLASKGDSLKYAHVAHRGRMNRKYEKKKGKIFLIVKEKLDQDHQISFEFFIINFLLLVRMK